MLAMHPDFLTILMMNTRTSMHGSIVPDDVEAAASTLPQGLHTVRMIHYPLLEHQKLMRHIGNDPYYTLRLHLLSDALARYSLSRRIRERLEEAMEEWGYS